MNILQALDDPKLYGAHPAFTRDPASWRPWRAFLGESSGLDLRMLASRILAPLGDEDKS